MAVFLADRVPAPRKLLWFGLGLAAMLGLRGLAPSPTEPLAPRAIGGCRTPHATPKADRYLGLVTRAPDDLAPAITHTATRALGELAEGHGWTIESVFASTPRASGFVITSTVDEIETARALDPNLDDRVETFVVTCTVSVHVGLYPTKIDIASTPAVARVTVPAYASESEQAAAREACVTSALEDAIQQSWVGIASSAVR